MGGNKYDKHTKKLIIEAFKSGIKQREIGKQLKIHESTVSRVISRYRNNLPIETRHSAGRPRKTDHRIDQKISNLIRREPFISSASIVKELNLTVDSSTVRRRAKEVNLRAYRAVKKPMLTIKHRQRR